MINKFNYETNINISQLKYQHQSFGKMSRMSHIAMYLLAFCVKWTPSQLMRLSGFSQTGTPDIPHIFVRLKS